MAVVRPDVASNSVNDNSPTPYMNHQELLKAGVHFGHLTRRWNPKMAPYIFMARKNVHIIDLNKTIESLEDATRFIQHTTRLGKKILFVGTKVQAKDILEQEATRLRMPYVTERWLGGMLTNFITMRRTMRRMQSMDKLMREPTYKNLAKRERLMLQRDKAKREKILNGIIELTRPPDVLFIVDINKEKIAVQEAQRLNIPIVAMVDTNANPSAVDYPIPANDDSTKSIEAIVGIIAAAVSAGLEERKQAQKKAQEKAQEKAQNEEKSSETRKTAPPAPGTKRKRIAAPSATPKTSAAPPKEPTKA